MGKGTIPRILIADDEPLYLRTTGALLRKEGLDCVGAADGQEALRRLRDEHFDLLISDLNMPGNFKMELLHARGTAFPHLPIIIVTGVPTLPTAIEALRMGIADYLLKPVRFADLLQSVRKALGDRAGGTAAEFLQASVEGAEQWDPFAEILGQSPAICELREMLPRIAQSETNVMITGESGTGKEIVARAIHSASRRRGGSFQVIDCSAIPELLFESMLFGHKKGAFTGAIADAEGLLKQCDGGTAFLDELGELLPIQQAKLLRAVQEQTFLPVGSHRTEHVNTRFISATNRDLEREVQRGEFRQDLYYRLGVLHLELPPLRARGDDILLLAEHFLRELQRESQRQTHFARIEGFSPAAIEALRNYGWPGNVRELRNVIERALALAQGPQILPTDLTKKVQGSLLIADSERIEIGGQEAEIAALAGSRSRALEQAERKYLIELLEQHRGNVSQAARKAGVSRQGLHKLLRKHDLQPGIYRDRIS